ncbi:outer membrane protein [Dongshaea marina]|uniref:outer membrane protein n=1 Tax=Dongshaea marina TaxID=2047966 RepID=UPI00131F0527|nr:outer membrane beta-barrel protein [Dongshaea marina]
MKKLVVVAAVASALACGSAMAQLTPYVGVNLGWGGMQTNDKPIDGLNQSSDSIGGVAGGINIGILAGDTPFQYGAEMGYYTYADNTYNYDSIPLNAQYKGNYFDLLGVGKYSFSSGWNIFGKAGAAYVTQKLNANADGFNVIDDTQHKILPKVALGVGYDFTSNWSANLQFSQVFGHKAPQFKGNITNLSDYDKVASVQMLTLGVAYRF